MVFARLHFFSYCVALGTGAVVVVVVGVEAIRELVSLSMCTDVYVYIVTHERDETPRTRAEARASLLLQAAIINHHEARAT